MGHGRTLIPCRALCAMPCPLCPCALCAMPLCCAPVPCPCCAPVQCPQPELHTYCMLHRSTGGAHHRGHHTGGMAQRTSRPPYGIRILPQGELSCPALALPCPVEALKFAGFRNIFRPDSCRICAMTWHARGAQGHEYACHSRGRVQHLARPTSRSSRIAVSISRFSSVCPEHMVSCCRKISVEV